jgi:hypothetical protein
LENKSKDDKEKKNTFFVFFLKSAGKVAGGGWSWAAVGGGWRLEMVGGGCWTQKIGLETCIESLIG